MNRTSVKAAAGDRPAGGGRFPFIDALRGLAVAVMIETHVVNALLAGGLRRGWFYDALTYVNGLVAPAFLFCAGLGFAIFLGRKNEEVSSMGPAFRAYLRRCLFVVLLGYSLHVPHFSLRAMIDAGPEAWRAFFQVDVLQVIGVTLLFLLLLAAALQSERGRSAAALAACLAAMGWWYFVPDSATAGWPDWLRAYVSREVSPLFTLAPWGAFCLAGFLAGRRFMGGAAAGKEAATVRTFALVSAGAALAALAAAAFARPLYPPGEWWYWSAEYFLLRLASVGLVMCLLWRLLRGGAEGPGARFLGAFGRESLAVYYIHLIIVYGRDFPWSFIRVFPEGSGYAFCALLSAALGGAMYFWAVWWGAAKRRHPRATAWAVRAAVAGSVLSFVFA